MSADDTSREALVKRVMIGLSDHVGWQASLDRAAEAVTDAVVMPLVEERDRLRGELEAPRDLLSLAVDAATKSRYTVTDTMKALLAATKQAAELDAAIKRAEEAEARVAHWQQRQEETANALAQLRAEQAAHKTGHPCWGSTEKEGK